MFFFLFCFCFLFCLRGFFCFTWGGRGILNKEPVDHIICRSNSFLQNKKYTPAKKKTAKKKRNGKNPQKKTMRLKLLLSNNFYVVILPSYRGMQFFYSHWLIFTSDCFKPCLVEMALEMTLKSYHRLALSLPLTPFEAQLRVPFNLGNLNSMPFKMLWAIFD